MQVKRLWVALGVLLLAAPVGLADVMTVGASKDTSLFEDPNGALGGGASSFFFVGRLGTNGSGLKRRGAITFNLSSIPANAVISQVSLTLTLSRGNGGDIPVELHRFTRDWGEGTSSGGPQGAPATAGSATWLHNFFNTSTWNSAGGDFDPAVSAVQDVGSFGPVTWTSTPRVVQDVQGWIANPASNFGWAVIGNETTLATAKEFNSREGFSGRPALTITYSVPEPGWLGMISIMGLGAVARRGRRCNMC